MLLTTLSIAEKLSTGGITALVGILMTFTMLAILIGCINLMNLIIKKSKVWIKKRKETNQSIPSSDITFNEDTQIEEKDTIETEIDENKLKAINSAVEMFMSKGANSKKSNYTIKHIKKD